MARIVAAALVLLALFTAPTFAQEEAPAPPSPSRPRLPFPSVNGAAGEHDPTENVKALSEAANKRQDDLRLADEKLGRALLDSHEKISLLRTEQFKELSAAQD